MRKNQILSFLLAILVASCSMSSVEDFVVGENFIKDKTGIVMIDTLSINTSIVKFDSVISNSSGRLLIGSNYNSFSGYKSANTFMEMTFDDNISYTKFIFDSLCMVMNYDTHYFGDTTITQTFKVHQLTEEMALEDSYLYTTSKFSYQSTPLGSISLKPRPNSKKAISIRLSDQYGLRLAQMIKDKNDTISSDELFRKFFKGLVIRSTSNIKGAVIGYSTTESESTSENTTTSGSSLTKPEIRLYYHLSPNPDNLTGLFYKFSFNSEGIYFNQIESNTNNSLIDDIAKTNNEKSTKLTNNQLLIQSGIQVFAKIKIPYLDNLLLMGKNSAFIGATIRFYPVKGTYTNSDNLPDSLYLFGANHKNQLTGQITVPGSTSDYSHAILTIEKDVEETVYYSADISSFVGTELSEQLETNSSLMIGYGSTDSKKTASHIVLGGSNSGKYAPKLNVYYYHN